MNYSLTIKTMTNYEMQDGVIIYYIAKFQRFFKMCLLLIKRFFFNNQAWILAPGIRQYRQKVELYLTKTT